MEAFAKAWEFFQQNDDANGIANVGRILGIGLASDGARDEAAEVLRQSEAAFRKLGQSERAEEIAARLRDLNPRKSRWWHRG